jgi:hypothetical protein
MLNKPKEKFKLNEIQPNKEIREFYYKLIDENFYNTENLELGIYNLIENFDVNLISNFNKRGLPLNCEISIYQISDNLSPKLITNKHVNKNHLSRLTMLKNMILIPRNIDKQAAIYFGFHNKPRMGHGILQEWEKTETLWIQIASRGTWKS